jgi:hypothetical protein
MDGQRPPARHARAATELTLVELLAAYLAFAKAHYVKDGKPTGEVGLIKLNQRIVRATYGNTLAKDFGPLALKALQQKMVGDGLCRACINAHCSRIKRMFRWAVSEELIDETVHRALATVPGLKKGRTDAVDYAPVQPVSDADVEATRLRPAIWLRFAWRMRGGVTRCTRSPTM